MVVIAALNLVLDFDFIENGVEQGAPKYMEWYGAFGLMVTLVWLYLEFLRLLSKLRDCASERATPATHERKRQRPSRASFVSAAPAVVMLSGTQERGLAARAATA